MALVASSQLRAARSMLRWEQERLAEASDVAISTVRRIEGLPGAITANVTTIQKLQRTLEAAGIEFQDEGRPGVRLRATSAA